MAVAMRCWRPALRPPSIARRGAATAMKDRAAMDRAVTDRTCRQRHTARHSRQRRRRMRVVLGKRLLSSSSAAAAAAAAASDTALPYERVVVTKFGGSSLGSGPAIRRVSDIVCEERERNSAVCLVASAMYGVTNQLVAAGEAAERQDRAEVARIRHEISGLHSATLDQLFDEDTRSVRDMAGSMLDVLMRAEFDQVTDDVSPQLSPADKDLLHSLGERLSATILNVYLLHSGERSRLVNSSHHIVASGGHGAGMPDLELTAQRLRRELLPLFHAHAIPVIPGFYGGDVVSGDVTTFGRGGSDLTAAIVGHAVDADVVTLYKVEHEKQAGSWRLGEWVDGLVGIVHSADLEETIAQVSYSEATEMAKLGKAVLHPQTVFPAVEKSIPVRVANTLDPTHAGTMITHEVTSRDPLEPLTVVKAPLHKLPSTGWHVDGVDWSRGISFQPPGTSVLDPGACLDDYVAVALVGIAVESTPLAELAAHFTAPLKAACIPFVAPEQLMSRNSFVLCVSQDHASQTMDVLHSAFVKGNSHLLTTSRGAVDVREALKDQES